MTILFRLKLYSIQVQARQGCIFFSPSEIYITNKRVKCVEKAVKTNKHSFIFLK